MNREIIKFYSGRLRSGNIGKDGLKEAVLAAVRGDDAELLRSALPLITEDLDWKEEYPSLFAVREMASPSMMDILLNSGYDRIHPDLNPFNGTPEELLKLMERISGTSRKEALVTLTANIAYFTDVLSADYSCYRIPFNIDPEDIYRPTFFTYLDSWLSDFARLLSEESDVDSSHLVRAVMKHPQLKDAAAECMALVRKMPERKKKLTWLINTAVSCDNEHAFTLLMELADRKSLSGMDSYPRSSISILERIFSMNLLIPGTDEGFQAFLDYISSEAADKENEELLRAIMHPSYCGKKDQYGRNILIRAIMNNDFEPYLYPVLIASGEMMNEKDCDGRTALFHLARTEYPECMEELIAMGADPLATDNEGNNVLHMLIKETAHTLSIIGHCMSFLPKELLKMRNRNGQTPLDMLSAMLTG